MITFRTKDNKTVEVPKYYMENSGLVRVMFEDEEDEERNYGPFDLRKINYRELVNIVKFCKYQVDGEGEKLSVKNSIKMPLFSNDMKDAVPEWYVNFTDSLMVDGNPFPVIELLKSANFMEIDNLIELCCAKIGSLLIGKSVEENRELFEIVGDLTEEEQAAFAKENQWCVSQN